MGRFFAILLVVAACGDNFTPPPGQSGQGGGATPNANAPLTPRFVPEVCGVREWSSVIAGSPAMNVSVVGRSSFGGAPTGADLLAVPTAGGTMTGFAVDTRMDVKGGANGVKVPIDDTFTAVSASQIDGRLVATAADIGAVRLSLLDDRLGNPREIAKLPLGFIADPAVFMADGARFVPIANDTGLVLHQFDAAWQPISSQQVATTSEPATGMTATQFGQTTLAVWSTQNTCNLMMLSTLSPNLGSQIAVPCAAPRIAAEAANGTATLVFEGGNAVRLMHISHTQMGGGSAMVRPGATSPRVVFDGQRYWVSYLDVRGDVIVGFVDGDGQVVSMSLAGPQPQHGAYELAMVDNAPWVFSLDATGYTAHRMCIVQEQ